MAASRGLRLAVVDAGKATPAREALHQAFATSLGAAVSARCGGTVEVRVRHAGADFAAFNLGTGVFDAVLYLGRDVPEALRRADAMTFSAVTDALHRERALHFIVPNGDTALQSLLTASFVVTLADQRFIDCLNSDTKIAAVAGAAKVALAAPSR